MKPLLRWAGSKKKLLKYLKPVWFQKNYKMYYEPFFGSGCLFFAVEPKKAVVSDVNNDLITTYVEVKTNPDQVYRQLIKIPVDKNQYYSWRSKDPAKLKDYQRATRFIFLNRYCFNGLYRTNKNGQFNVPFSPTKTGKIQSKNEFRVIAGLLKRSDVICSDFEVVIEKSEQGDFVYVDPPYSINNNRINNQYGPENFGKKDFERLVRSLIKADQRGVDFLLSYADCNEVRELQSCWYSKEISVRRNIAGFAKHRKIVREMLISNIKLDHIKRS